MKFLAIILIAMGFSTLNARESWISWLKSDETEKTTKTSRGGHRDENTLAKILEYNEKIQELLQKRSNIPVIWMRGEKILTGAVFRGTLLNSINSTNLNSPVLVLAHEGQGLAPLSKFSCQGVTQNKRVFILCNKLITPEREIPVQAQVLNMDGTSGLIGEYDDGKEDLIMGAIASDFAAGMFSAAQTRISGPLGAIREDSVKNQLLGGLIQSGQTTSEILLNEMKTKEPIVSVEAGTEVLIYFMEAINED